MPTRGPKPKPEAIKKLGGRSHKKKETVNLIEFPIPEEMKKLPHEIRMELEDIWKYLIDLNIANPVDWGAFSRYIVLRGIQKKAIEDIEKRGAVIQQGKTRERFNPSFRILQSTSTELLKLEEQFGLTPSARRRLPAQQPKKKVNGYAERRENRLRSA